MLGVCCLADSFCCNSVFLLCGSVSLGFVGSLASLVPPNTNANPIRIKRHERFDGFIEQQQITAETGFLLAHLTTKWQALGTAKFNGKSTWVFHCYFSGDL